VTALPQICLFTRYPTPGRAKTRLIPALGAEGAAALHRRLTERALAEIRATGLPHEVRATGASAAAFRRWLGDVRVAPQGRGHLGARMRRAVGQGPAILVGADIPDLSAALIRDAVTALAAHPAVIGPAADGGYWLIGLRAPVSGLFAPLAWGGPAVFAETMARFARAGIAPALLPELADLDRPEDLTRWPGL